MSGRDELVTIARSLFDRGYTFGTAGNISIRAGDRFLMTPTNSSFFNLTPDSLSEVDGSGALVSGSPPTKEAHLHLAVYRARPQACAVVHLHSRYATALSCLADVNCEDALPVYTPYYAMRIPCLPVAGYYPPGDPQLAPAVETAARISPALLLRNHGSIATGKTLMEAAALAEEIEEQARLFFLLEGRGRRLGAEEIAELRRRFQ
jgi:ribulose-5-phosphate 4-epimerase/fuculose-1-phosphate aldolase